MSVKGNLILALFHLIFTSFSFAQKQNQITKDTIRHNNELRLGIVKIIGAVVDVEYERTLNKIYSYGSNLLFAIGRNNSYNFYDFSLSPFFRLYTEKNQGYFIQGFINYYYGRDVYSNHKPFNGLAIGISLGDKFTFKQIFKVKERFVSQASIGIAKTIITDRRTKDPDARYLFGTEDIFLQAVISFGYKF